MKTILATLFISLFAASAIAQTYQYVPMPQSDAHWRYRLTHRNIMYPQWNVDDFSLLIDGSDTTINNTVYKRMLYRPAARIETTAANTPLTHVVAATPDMPYYPIREQDKKVYIYKDQQEKLLYDFNLGIGDTIPTPEFYLPYPLSWPPSYVITNIDTISFAGTLRKRFEAKGVIQLFDTLYIIEGVGTERGIIPANFPFSGGMYNLRPKFYCFTHQGNVYQNTDSCYYIWPFGIPTAVAGTREDEAITVYPNPFSQDLRIKNLPEGTLLIYDMTGRLCLQQDVKEKNMLLNLTQLNKGIYFIIATDKQGSPVYKQKIVKE